MDKRAVEYNFSYMGLVFRLKDFRFSSNKIFELIIVSANNQSLKKDLKLK